MNRKGQRRLVTFFMKFKNNFVNVSMFRSFSAKNTLLFLAAPRLHQPTHRLNLINESKRVTELTEIQK